MNINDVVKNFKPAYKKLVRSVELKPCGKCKELKLKTEFNKRERNKDGLQTYCRVCYKVDYKKTIQYCKGNAPTAEGWTIPVEIGMFNERIWWISHIVYDEPEWNNVKVFSLERERSKANFYLNYNLDRFNHNLDFKILVKRYTGLLNAIKDYWINRVL